MHGIAFPWVAATRAGSYGWRRVFGKKTFSIGGRTCRYEVHPFILNNERAVEIGIARQFLAGRKGNILEVGNVLSAYMTFHHDVVDKYERAPGVINEDIVTYRPAKRYDAIVSLSTLEHVGWDEHPKEPAKIERAIENLRSLLAPGGELLVTMPLGYNLHLDDLVRNQRTGLSEVRFMKRFSKNNTWREAQYSEVAGAVYGHPFPCGNAIVVGWLR